MLLINCLSISFYSIFFLLLIQPHTALIRHNVNLVLFHASDSIPGPPSCTDVLLFYLEAANP